MKTFFVTLFSLVLAIPAWAEVKIQEVTSPGRDHCVAGRRPRHPVHRA